jgi:hypothetical protein
MPRKRSKGTREDPLAAYRRIRKPMPPPARTDEDRRRESLDDVERREARDAAAEATAGRRGPGAGPTDAGER